MLLSARATNKVIRSFVFPSHRLETGKENRDLFREISNKVCMYAPLLVVCSFVDPFVARNVSDSYPMLLTQSDEQQNAEQ